MKLNQSDKEILRSWNHTEQDIEQIERATNTKNTTYSMNGRKITQTKAIEILGRKEYLSGISRSAFHWSAARKTLYGDNVVHFDSSKLFERDI